MLSSLSQAGANPAIVRTAAPMVPAPMAHTIGYATTPIMTATIRGARDRRRPPFPTVRPARPIGEAGTAGSTARGLCGEGAVADASATCFGTRADAVVAAAAHHGQVLLCPG